MWVKKFFPWLLKSLNFAPFWLKSYTLRKITVLSTTNGNQFWLKYFCNFSQVGLNFKMPGACPEDDIVMCIILIKSFMASFKMTGEACPVQSSSHFVEKIYQQVLPDQLRSHSGCASSTSWTIFPLSLKHAYNCSIWEVHCYSTLWLLWYCMGIMP